MVRTQIQLTERQARLVRDAARRKGVSIAELIRRALDDALAESERQQQPLAILELRRILLLHLGQYKDVQMPEKKDLLLLK